MGAKKHYIFTKAIWAYFGLFIVTLLFSGLFGKLDALVAKILPGFTEELEMLDGTTQTVHASGPGYALGALAVAFLFYFIFRKTYKGILGKNNILKGTLLILPLVIISVTGSIVAFFFVGTSNVLIAFLKSLAPGFNEEIAMRGPGVANYMRKHNDDRGILTIFWFSSAVFGLTHVFNMFFGAAPALAVLQAFYTMGLGMALCAVFLRTGNLWPAIIAHTVIDFVELIRGDFANNGGVMQGMNVGDWIVMSSGLAGFFLGLYLIRKEKRSEIIKIWEDKWKLKEDKEIENIQEADA